MVKAYPEEQCTPEVYTPAELEETPEKELGPPRRDFRHHLVPVEPSHP